MNQEWKVEIEENAKKYLMGIEAPLEDWETVVQKARKNCQSKYAYHAWLIKTFASIHPEFAEKEVMKLHFRPN